MSTEHQKYSTENQEEAIARYAAARGLSIVKTYADAGKSGLSLDGREALRQLIDDVQAGVAEFGTILVYDVSRWGRFQDADESAYYEFICKEAGITVQYCAEQFENDGSLAATIIKGMKRAMAGEYSRELSAKVFAGQCRLISLGFRQGGPAGYGLRRQLINESRHPKALLSRGERKSLQTDRVILVPGPEQELETIRWIYRLFVVQRKSEGEIAAALNDSGIRNEVGGQWTRGTIHQILINEKYIGNNVYNRVSFKLKQRRVVNPPDIWVRTEAAFEPVIDADFFQAAQRIIEERNRRFTDEELLERLTAVLREKGAVSGLVIDEIEGMPSSSTYRHRFGSLVRAYHLIGYVPKRDYRYLEINRALRSIHPGVVAKTIAKIEEFGGAVEADPLTDLLLVNGEFTASIVIVRATRTVGGALRWKIRLDAGLAPDITVAVRMDAENAVAFDYYLLPKIDISADRIQLAEENGALLDAYRFDTLEPLFHLAARANIQVAA